MNQLGIEGCEIVTSESHRIETAGIGIVEEHVGGPQKLSELVAATDGLDIDDDAALTPVIGPVGEAGVGVADIVDERADVASVDATGRLDSDYLGAESGEQMPGELADASAHVDDTNMFEQLGPLNRQGGGCPR